jgi:hypothetical protein
MKTLRKDKYVDNIKKYDIYFIGKQNPHCLKQNLNNTHTAKSNPIFDPVYRYYRNNHIIGPSHPRTSQSVQNPSPFKTRSITHETKTENCNYNKILHIQKQKSYIQQYTE